MRRRKVTPNMDVRPEEADVTTLFEMSIEHMGKSLELKIKAGMTRDMGILWLKELPYIFDCQWEVKNNKIIFQLEVWQVLPSTMNLVASRNFDEEI
jgi:hypothetical protein